METHPAFGLIGASRGSSTPGAVLFDSEIRHRNVITIRIKRACRERKLNTDWLFGRQELIEVQMSEAQWASFVSSMNTGDGVPCTITRYDDELMVPGLPYTPRLAQSMDYAHQAANKAFESIKAVFQRVKEKPTKANLRDMEIALQNAVPNVDFAGKTLVEHVENTVVKARADIEAMVARHAETLGIEPGSYTAPLALGASDDSAERMKGDD